MRLKLIDDWRHKVPRSAAVWCGVAAGVFGSVPIAAYLVQGYFDGRLLGVAVLVASLLSGLLGILGTPVGRSIKQRIISGD